MFCLKTLHVSYYVRIYSEDAHFFPGKTNSRWWAIWVIRTCSRLIRKGIWSLFILLPVGSAAPALDSCLFPCPKFHGLKNVCATACYSCSFFPLKKQGRKRGWLDMEKENTPPGQDDCKKKGNYWLISCILSCFTGPPTLNLSTSFFPKSAPCTLTKLHYRLDQNTNAILTEKMTKGQNIGSNSRCNFFCNSLFPKDREKSPSKHSEFSSQDLVFQGCKMHIPLYNTSKKN